MFRRTFLIGLSVALAAGTVAVGNVGTVAATVSGTLSVTETAPWSSGNTTLAQDWFEVTNVSAVPVDITGWKVDDNSNLFGSALAITLQSGSAIAPGQSVIFIETPNIAASAAAFSAMWAAPAGCATPTFVFGSYTGASIGLGTSGDAVNLFDSIGVPQASVTFGASSAAGGIATFDNSAGANNLLTMPLSVVGTNGAYTVTAGVIAPVTSATGSPGRTSGLCTPTSTTAAPTTATAAPTTTVAPTELAWPGGTAFDVVGTASLDAGNLSGLEYEVSGSSAPGILWAVVNNPSILHKLTWNGTNWVPSAGDWVVGKTMVYPSGTGVPDSEGLTLAAATAVNGIFVGTERNNSASATSKNAILRFDPTAAGTTLTANGEWDITSSIPANAANNGIETVTWIPDSFLLSKGFLDEATNAAYSPATYPNHGTGIFVVGIEGTANLAGAGIFYAYALDLTTSNVFTKIATFTSGLAQVMASDFDSDTGLFWAHCDNGCLNKSTTLVISPTTHKFVVTNTYSAPVGMLTSMNNEGMAIAPDAECVGGVKPVYWSDDGDTGGFSLRRSWLNCITLSVDVPEFPGFLLPSLMAIALLGGFVMITRRRGTSAA